MVCAGLQIQFMRVRSPYLTPNRSTSILITKNDGLNFKRQMMQYVINPANRDNKNPKLPMNIRYFTKYDPHVFTRVLERGIDKDDFSSLFSKLLEQKYDSLLEIFDKDRSKMNSKDSVALFVKYNGVSVCFIVFDDSKDNYYSLMPLTVFDNYEYKKCDYEIELV